MKIIGITLNLIVAIVIIGLVSGFSSLARRPFTTILFFGFDVQRLFARWGLTSLGWIIGMVLFIATVLTLLAFIAWVYNKSRKIISSYRGKNAK